MNEERIKALGAVVIESAVDENELASAAATLSYHPDHWRVAILLKHLQIALNTTWDEMDMQTILDSLNKDLTTP